MATIIPRESEEALPPKFLDELVVHQRPGIIQAEDAVRDASIACSFPSLPIGNVEIKVHQISLKSLERT